MRSQLRVVWKVTRARRSPSTTVPPRLALLVGHVSSTYFSCGARTHQKHLYFGDSPEETARGSRVQWLASSNVKGISDVRSRMISFSTCSDEWE